MKNEERERARERKEDTGKEAECTSEVEDGMMVKSGRISQPHSPIG